MNNPRLCKFFYEKGHCRKAEQCNFVHDKTIDYQSYQNINRNRNQKPKHRRHKNTETFEPSFIPPDMRLIVETGGDKYPREHRTNDVIVIHNLFCDKDDMTIYDNLMDEILSVNMDQDKLWKLWHGDTHLIVDDKMGWKDYCPTFNKVIKKIKDYFEIDIKATRFNLYDDSTHWKPFHHDAAAVKKDKALTQNITIGISFGLEREVAFEHAKTKTVISLPLCNGSVYIFNKDVNIEWKHGILQMNPNNFIEKGRISIIAWGWVPMKDK